MTKTSLRQKEKLENSNQININLDYILDKQFRKRVYQKKGMKRGVIKEALTEAIELWIKESKGVDKK